MGLLFSLFHSMFVDTFEDNISGGAGSLEGWLPITLSVMSKPLIVPHHFTELILKYLTFQGSSGGS